MRGLATVALASFLSLLGGRAAAQERYVGEMQTPSGTASHSLECETVGDAVVGRADVPDEDSVAVETRLRAYFDGKAAADPRFSYALSEEAPLVFEAAGMRSCKPLEELVVPQGSEQLQPRALTQSVAFTAEEVAAERERLHAYASRLVLVAPRTTDIKHATVFPVGKCGQVGIFAYVSEFKRVNEDSNPETHLMLTTNHGTRSERPSAHYSTVDLTRVAASTDMVPPNSTYELQARLYPNVSRSGDTFALVSNTGNTSTGTVPADVQANDVCKYSEYDLFLFSVFARSLRPHSCTNIASSGPPTLCDDGLLVLSRGAGQNEYRAEYAPHDLNWTPLGHLGIDLSVAYDENNGLDRFFLTADDVDMPGGWRVSVTHPHRSGEFWNVRDPGYTAIGFQPPINHPTDGSIFSELLSGTEWLP